MPLQYLQNDSGESTVVLIPIEEWKAITQRHGDLAGLGEAVKKEIKSHLIIKVSFPLHWLTLCRSMCKNRGSNGIKLFNGHFTNA